MKKREVRVEVTQRDIDRGKPRDTEECPVALALKRGLKASRGGVGLEGFYFVEHGFWQRFFRQPSSRVFQGTLPEAARSFIALYDGYGSTPQPFSFEVEV
jgi:hypothetical protein